MAQSSPHPSPFQATLILVALVPLIGIFIALGTAARIADHLFIGFTFICYWNGMKAGAPADFLPALLGSLGGLGMAWLDHVLPAAYGTSGAVGGGLAIALSVYLLIRRQATAVVNSAFMLLLTVSSSFAFKTSADYAAGAEAIGLAAAYAGILECVRRGIAGRRARARKAMAAWPRN